MESSRWERKGTARPLNVDGENVPGWPAKLGRVPRGVSKEKGGGKRLSDPERFFFNRGENPSRVIGRGGGEIGEGEPGGRTRERGRF